MAATSQGFIPRIRLFSTSAKVLLARARTSPHPEMPWLVSSRTRHRKSFSYCGETMATRISVILSADGLEFVFICAETVSRSAWVIRLPAAIAEVAAVAVVIHVLREIPEDSAIVGFSLLPIWFAACGQCTPSHS